MHRFKFYIFHRLCFMLICITGTDCQLLTELTLFKFCFCTDYLILVPHVPVFASYSQKLSQSNQWKSIHGYNLSNWPLRIWADWVPRLFCSKNQEWKMHLTGVDVECLSAWAGLVNIQPFIALGRLDEKPSQVACVSEDLKCWGALNIAGTMPRTPHHWLPRGERHML